MRTVPVALLLGASACQEPADGTGPTDHLQRSGSDSAAILSLEVAIGCAGELYEDYDDGCQTLLLDASETSTSNGEIVAWEWSLDGSTYTSAEVIRAFKLDPKEETTTFTGTLTMKDEAGEVFTADIWITGMVVEMVTGGTALGDPELFWFSGVTQTEGVYGPSCQIQITAVSGCLTAPFHMEWLDFASGDPTFLIDWFGLSGPPPSFNQQFMNPYLQVLPSRLVMRLELPTANGSIEVDKEGQHISHVAHCTPPNAPE